MASSGLTVTITMMGSESREMCWEQGKPCVYISKDDKFIVAEWRNGVVQRRNIETGEIVRTRPDGHVDTFTKGDPEAYKEPILPD